VLEDPIPEINSKLNIGLQGKNVAVVSTFSYDEPIDEVISAAAKVSDVNFHITGNLAFAKSEYLTNKPTNVHYTDFLDYNEYLALLASVDAIIVLTKNDNTMLSGAYEALALGKPLITSNWPVLTKYFNRGTIHVNNTAEEIAEAVKKAISEKYHFTTEIETLRLIRKREWELKFKELLSLLEIR
jgi:glycosyltransferase involved in cell wall biosynthesis